MAAKDEKTRIRHAIDEVFNKGNMIALDDIMATDIVYHQPPRPDLKGLEAYKQFFTDLRKAFPNMQYTIDDLIIDGDTSAARYTLRGTHTGQWMGIPPTGKRVTWTGLWMTRTANGMGVEQWVYSDTLGLMQQLGIAPPK
jgi:predicted ester cyclase